MRAESLARRTGQDAEVLADQAADPDAGQWFPCRECGNVANADAMRDEKLSEAVDLWLCRRCYRNRVDGEIAEGIRCGTCVRTSNGSLTVAPCPDCGNGVCNVCVKSGGRCRPCCDDWLREQIEAHPLNQPRDEAIR